VKIDISDQILKWRRVMAEKGYLPLAKRLSCAVAGHVFAHPEEFHAVEKMAGPVLDHMPHFLLLNNKRPGAWPVRCIRYTRYRRVKVYLSDLHKLEWLRFLGYSARYPLQARIRSGQAVPS